VATGDAATFRFPALYQAGFAALRLDRAAVAAEHFAAAVAAATEDSGRHECRYLAGDAALRAGEHAAARQWFEQALAAGSGEFADDAALALGFCALAAGDQDAALAAFTAVANRHPDSPVLPRAQLEIGRIRYQRHDHAGAEQVLRPLAASDDAELARQSAELLSLCAVAGGRGAQAIEPLRQALAAAPRSEQPRLQFALAEALADAGQWQPALAATKRRRLAAMRLRGDALYGGCFTAPTGRHDESTCARGGCGRSRPTGWCRWQRSRSPRTCSAGTTAGGDSRGGGRCQSATADAASAGLVHTCAAANRTGALPEISKRRPNRRTCRWRR
jgi:Tfp pilus assembly protein PilF